MKCDHSSSNRVIVEGDRQPNGWQFPRCAQCGHRTSYAGSQPTAMRYLVMRHPSYLFTELIGRYTARQMGSHPTRL